MVRAQQTRFERSGGTWLVVSLALAGATLAGAPTAVGATFPAPATPAPIASKRLACQPAQIDVNSATVAQLTAGLDLSRPVAERVVEHRKPLYLDLEDLLVVEGIGAGALARLVASKRACVDLPSTPPPTDAHVCSGHDQRVDVNRPGSRRALEDLFGRPTAERIVAGMPYSGLASVVSEHIPGAGKGKAAKLAERLCATPPTIDHESTRWGWASDAGGRVDHPGGGTLTVPAGTVGPGGAWGSVADLPWTDDDSGPRYDMHLHASWADGDRAVYVTLPPDPFVAPSGSGDWTPTVLHGPQGSEDVHAVAGVHRGGDGRITAAVTSLSEVRTLLQPSSTFGTAFFYLDKETLASLTARKDLEKPVSTFDGCDPDASGDARLSVWADPPRLLTGDGLIYGAPASWCAQGPIGNSARLRLANQSKLAMSMDVFGPADTIDVFYGSEPGPFERLFMEGVNRRTQPGDDDPRIIHGPGAIVLLDVHAAQADSKAQISYDPIATSGIIIAARLGVIDGLADVTEFVGCLDGIDRGRWTPARLLGCGYQALRQAKLSNLQRVATLLKGVIRALNVFDLGATGIEVLRATFNNLSNGDAYDGIVYANLERPARSPGSGGTPGEGGGLDGTLPAGPMTDIIVGSASGYPDQLTRGGDGVGHRIPGGGTYACLTRVYLMRDRASDADAFKYIQANGEAPASCEWVEGEPEITLPAGSRNFIMRQLDSESWLLDETGHRRKIATGAVYHCLAQRLFVIDNRSDAEIAAFTPAADGADASCG